MQGLVQADGDFDLVADIIEGLEKLPPDLDLSKYEGATPCALILYSQSEGSCNLGSHAFAAETQDDIDRKCDYYKCLGFHIVLQTPVLPTEEVARYHAALDWEPGAPTWAVEKRLEAEWPTIQLHNISVKYAKFYLHTSRELWGTPLTLAPHTVDAYHAFVFDIDTWSDIIIGLLLRYQTLNRYQIIKPMCEEIGRLSESKVFPYTDIECVVNLLIRDGWIVEDETSN